jgi:hypothetical protein
MLRDNSHYWSPDGGYGAQIVVASIPLKGPDSETEGWEYSLWDPVTGSTTPEWTDVAGLQETYMQSDGDWLETVTRGFGGTAAMADWTMILRNLKTGEKRDIAKAQPGQAEVNTSQITLQNDPDPSLAGGKLVWASAELLAGEGVQSTVQMYDIASGATTTVETKTDHAREDFWSARIGGDKMAWFSNDGTTNRIVIHDLATGAEQTINVDSQPFSLTLSPDGRFLAWDTIHGQGTYDKHLLNLATQEQTAIATEQGYGVYLTDRYLSWDTGNTGPGYAPSGLYDLQANELRPLIPVRTTLTNVGHVMGDWFVWQDIPLVGSEYRDDLGKWYAMRLPNSSTGTPGPPPTLRPGDPAVYAEALDRVQQWLYAWMAGDTAAQNAMLDPESQQLLPTFRYSQPLSSEISGYQPAQYVSDNEFTLLVDLQLHLQAANESAWGEGVNSRFITFQRADASSPFRMHFATSPPLATG